VSEVAVCKWGGRRICNWTWGLGCKLNGEGVACVAWRVSFDVDDGEWTREESTRTRRRYFPIFSELYFIAPSQMIFITLLQYQRMLL
jgi:hypothetical protein